VFVRARASEQGRRGCGGGGAGMSGVLYSIEFFVYEKLEVQKCTRTDISERWHPCSPLLMILSFLVTSVIVRIKEKRYA